MAKFKNNEHYNIAGNKKVRVVVEFDAGGADNDRLLIQLAQDYLTYYLSSGNHKAWGYGIETQR